MAIGDERDNVSILNLIDDHWIERAARAIVVAFGAIARVLRMPSAAGRRSDLTLRGTIDSRNVSAARSGSPFRRGATRCKTLLDVTDGGVLSVGRSRTSTGARSMAGRSATRCSTASMTAPAGR